MAQQSQIDQLVAEFAAYLAREGIDQDGDAMELLMGTTLTDAQRSWISDFVVRWDRAAEANPRFYDEQTVVPGP